MLQWPLGDEIVLWSATTGRHARIAPETLTRLDELEVVRTRLAGLGLVGRVDAEDLVAVRSKLVLLRPDRPSLWLPLPGVRTAGGHGWTERPLTAAELATWRAINDARTVRAVAEHAGVGLVDALAFLRTLTAPDVQAAQLRDRPPHPRDASLWHLVAPERPLAARTADQRGAAGETTLTAWHLAIADGERHFDDVETTVAHALGLPHPALGGQRYGERLHDALAARGWLDGARTIAEVGCGDGELALAWLTRWPDPARYLRIDLSPELLRTQRRRVPRSPGVLGDAAALPLRDGSIDWVLSNEVIADLSAAPWGPEVAERVARYGLERLPGEGPYNLGAWRFLEEIARVLAPGGRAFLSEFGELDAPPEEAVQLDHPEVSIHFGHLVGVARGLGLQAEVVRLDDLLGLDPSARQLARLHYEGLRAMARASGLHLSARAWTPETLLPPQGTLPWPVEGLAWVPLTEPGPGPLVTRFHALLVHREED